MYKCIIMTIFYQGNQSLPNKNVHCWAFSHPFLSTKTDKNH